MLLVPAAFRQMRREIIWECHPYPSLPLPPSVHLYLFLGQKCRQKSESKISRFAQCQFSNTEQILPTKILVTWVFSKWGCGGVCQGIFPTFQFHFFLKASLSISYKYRPITRSYILALMQYPSKFGKSISERWQVNPSCVNYWCNGGILV